MPGDKGWCCMICEQGYASLEEAEVCERRHAAHRAATDAVVDHAREHGLTVIMPPGWCVFCDHDPCQCYTAPAPAALAPEEILRLGALTLQQESSAAVERLLEDQAATYQAVLRAQGPQALIEALVARDRLLANQGRQIADGRTVSRIAREMVRAALYSAGGRPDAQAVQRAIEAFAPEERGQTDLRQLKLHGSTLGPLESPETAAEQLASGERKQSRGAVVSDGALRKGE